MPEYNISHRLTYDQLTTAHPQVPMIKALRSALSLGLREAKFDWINLWRDNPGAPPKTAELTEAAADELSAAGWTVEPINTERIIATTGSGERYQILVIENTVAADKWEAAEAAEDKLHAVGQGLAEGAIFWARRSDGEYVWIVFKGHAVESVEYTK
jgi:hypothetical protein